jgi:hypothetical protein
LVIFEPHPLYPPLLKKERGNNFGKRGKASLKLSFILSPLTEGEEILERGEAPLLPILPLPFIIFKGRGQGG